MRGTLLRGVALTLLLSGVAVATTLKRMTLEQVSDGAREIVVGTVESKTAVDGDGERAVISTDVVFGTLDVWKGSVATSRVTYRFAGGAIGARRLRVPGMPQFEVGRRYVLFANPDTDDICPTVGWIQGTFEIRKLRATRDDHVYDADGHPVYGFAGGLPVRKPSEERPRPLTLVEFQVEVARALAAAKERAEKAAAEGRKKAVDPQLATDEEKREQPPAPKDPRPSESDEKEDDR